MFIAGRRFKGDDIGLGEESIGPAGAESGQHTREHRADSAPQRDKDQVVRDQKESEGVPHAVIGPRFAEKCVSAFGRAGRDPLHLHQRHAEDQQHVPFLALAVH